MAGTAAAAGTTGMEAAMATGMIGGMTTGAINGAGITALAGGQSNDILAGMVQGSVIGGFSGFMGGAAFQGTNDILRGTPSWLPKNTVSYLSGSISSKATARVLSGTGFEGFAKDIFLDPGLLVPTLLDIASGIPPLFNNKYNSKIQESDLGKYDPEVRVNAVDSYVDREGNLDLEFSGRADWIKPERTVTRHKIEQGARKLGRLTIPTFKRISYQHTIPAVPRNMNISVSFQLYRNYRSLVYSLYLNNL